MDKTEILEYLVERCVYEIDVAACSMQEVYRRGVNQLFSRDEVNHDYAQQILTELLLSEKLGTFAFEDGFCMPHLVLDYSETKTKKVGWFISSEGITDDHGKGDYVHVFFFVFGSEEFVRQLTGAASELCKCDDFLNGAKSASSSSELKAHITSSADTVLEPNVLKENFGENTEHTTREMVVLPCDIHSRPGVRLVRLALCFECRIVVRCEDRIADVKSIIPLLAFGGTAESQIVIEATGKGASEAVITLARFIAQGFPEAGGYTAVTAQCDVGWGRALYIRGNVPPLSCLGSA